MSGGSRCLSCGQPVAAGEELCSGCRTVRVALADVTEVAPAVAEFPIAPALVGAKRALAGLIQAFDGARGGRGLAFVALEGAAGTGKTRLVAELADAIAERDGSARVFVAGAGASAVPFGPLARVLAARLGIPAGASAGEAQARIIGAVAELLPGPQRLEAAHLVAHLLGAGFPESPVVEPLAGTPARLEARAFLAVRRFLGADAARAPLVLAIDDAEQAGPETVRLLHYLAAGLPAARILIVVAGREGAAALRPTELERVERIVLGPLAPAEAEDLLRLLLAPAGAAPAKLVAHARRGAVTPRALVELVRLLLEARVIARARGDFAVDAARLAALALPEREVDVTAARLALMAPGDRELLGKAAVCGERFWVDALLAMQRAETPGGGGDGPTLEEIAAEGDRSRATTIAALGRLRASGWLAENEQRFAYSPLRELVAGAMDPEARRRHHRCVAQWLELRPDGRDEATQEEIGEHLAEAGDGDAAAAGFRRAADGARGRYFNDKAIRLYTRALGCVATGNLAARIHVWHDLGSVYELKGDFEGALGAYERMLRLSWVASSPGKAAVAMNKVGRVWRRKGNLRLALEHLERGLALFEQAGDGRGVAASLDDIGRVLHLLGRYDEAHAKITSALSRRGKDGDRRSLAHSLSTLAEVQKDRGQLDEAQACLGQALELRRALGDRAGVVMSMQSLGMLAFERGERDEARRSWEQALDDAERIGALPLQGQLLCHLGEVALAQGKAEEARRRLRDALGLARELDDKRLLGDASRLLGLAELAGGDRPRALELCDAALKVAGEAGLRGGVGRALLALGEVSAATLHDEGSDGSERVRADELFARGVALFRELGNSGELARGLARHGRHRLEVGDRDGAQPLLDEARAIYARLGLPVARVIPDL